MRYRRLISVGNLELAWHRLTTAYNVQYKRFYRPLLAAYELGLRDNLRYLHARLQGGWRPSTPSRIFLPKPSGLQRPVTLLPLEDQIVLQAVANLVAETVWRKRKRIEGVAAFSNLLCQPKDSIFFVEHWRTAYPKFQRKLETIFNSGLNWVAHFDLAAFYDTISHEALITAIAPRAHGNDVFGRIRKWLEQWSSTDAARRLQQGLPQGPIASNFLAEVFLMPLDKAMVTHRIAYARYVDDIRLLATTENDTKRAAILLERECRALGLIPQSKKFHIRRASSVSEVLGSLPSLQRRGAADAAMTEKRALRVLASAVGGRPLRILDKSRFRYLLFHAPPSRKILQTLILLLPQHPEHIDAFRAFFDSFTRSKPLEDALVNLLCDGVPYDYVRGELWHVLRQIASNKTLSTMLEAAKADLEPCARTCCLSLVWGIGRFLLECHRRGLCRFPRKRLQGFPCLAQSLLVPELPESAYETGRLAPWLLKGKRFEPGIVLAGELIRRKKSLRDLGLRNRDLSRQVQNVFKRVGLIARRSGAQYDQIGQILHARYNIQYWDKWRSLLGSEYMHALRILRVADLAFEAHSSQWLQNQDAFNDLLVRSLLGHLTTRSLPGGMSVHGKGGALIDYAVLLDSKQKFARNHKDLADELRKAHKRRNTLPASHPYAKRTRTRNTYLQPDEKPQLRHTLTKAYARVIALMSPHLKA